MPANLANASLALAITLAVAPSAASAASAASGGFAAPPVSIADALTCKLTVPQYNGFAVNLQDEDSGYKSYGWVKLTSPTVTLNLYRLPEAVMVDGHATTTLAFSASGVAAVLADVDPTALAQELGIKNALPSATETAAQLGMTPEQAKALPVSTAFKGERVVVDKTEQDPDLGKIHTRIVRHVETNAKLPGKTLDGCSYTIDFPGR